MIKICYIYFIIILKIKIPLTEALNYIYIPEISVYILGISLAKNMQIPYTETSLREIKDPNKWRKKE